MASWPLPVGVAGHRAGEGGQGLPAVFPGAERDWEPPWIWAGVYVAGECLTWLPALWGTGGPHHILPMPTVPLYSLSAPPCPSVIRLPMWRE